MRELVLASGNLGKLAELEALLAGLELRVRAQSEFGIPAAEETGTTFLENAIIKARHAARLCRRPSLADDSGLMVNALGGAPGVRSARYAGLAASDEDNVRKLLQATREVPARARACRYVCVMVYMHDADDPMPLVASAVWEGRLLAAPQGHLGFGYDPVFEVRGHGCSAAELEPAVKNCLSHRGQALALLRAGLVREFGA